MVVVVVVVVCKIVQLVSLLSLWFVSYMHHLLDFLVLFLVAAFLSHYLIHLSRKSTLVTGGQAN
jgi:hypothetical protein